LDLNPKAEALRPRTKRFAIDVVLFAKTLSFDEPDRSVSRQLARAATSVGANWKRLIQEAGELTAIFAASSITARHQSEI